MDLCSLLKSCSGCYPTLKLRKHSNVLTSSVRAESAVFVPLTPTRACSEEQIGGGSSTGACRGCALGSENNSWEKTVSVTQANTAI